MLNRFIILIASTLALSTGAMAQQGESPQRAIEKVTGDLYRAQNGGHYTIVLVTAEGIIISDPINNEFALWLKDELKKRFNKSVKYVLYSHHHWDHATGGGVFNETATFIGHENMANNLIAANDTPLSRYVSSMDQNKNGTIENSEASGRLANNFAVYDTNKDGKITGAEYHNATYSSVRAPDIGYKDRMVVTLGGKKVEMIYTGKNHSDDMSVLYFPAEKAVFIVDFIAVKRLPYRYMDGGIFPDWIDSIKAVETIDFETFAPGHGIIGTKQDVTDHRQYIEDLVTAVAKGIKEDKSVEALQKTITLDKYKTWNQYNAWRAENIAGMYRILNEDVH